MIVLLGSATASDNHARYSVGSTHSVVAVVDSDDVDEAEKQVVAELVQDGFAEAEFRKVALVAENDEAAWSPHKREMFTEAKRLGFSLAVFRDDDRDSRP